MDYIKKFNSHTEYELYINNETNALPNVSYCKNKNEVHYNPIPYENFYLTFVALEDCTFSLDYYNVKYSTDGGITWLTLAPGNSTPTITKGNSIIWKATISPSINQGAGRFHSTGRFDVQGNAMSLLFGDNFKGKKDLTGKMGAFDGLFMSCDKVVNAENLSLPATTLGYYCYQEMFWNCSSLLTAPKLPATTMTVNCYYGMFKGCTSLIKAPELPATTLANACYNSMFRGCTSLTTAPELPATTMKQNCYASMFQECTFTATPELPATTLAASCYDGMFRDCTSLTTISELPATTMANRCYNYMFSGCTSLTTAPELPATTLESMCYDSMFDGCSSLNYIKAMFTTEPSNAYTYNWVNGVASSGKFVKNAEAIWSVTGVNGIPEGWTIKYFPEVVA